MSDVAPLSEGELRTLELEASRGLVYVGFRDKPGLPSSNLIALVAAAQRVAVLESRVAELEAENERIRGELTLERGSVGRADLQTKVLLASDQRDRAWALLRDLGVTVMP